MLTPIRGLTAQAADPLIGTWKLNVAKSEYNPGPAPKSATLTFEATRPGIKFTGKGVGQDGVTSGGGTGATQAVSL